MGRAQGQKWRAHCQLFFVVFPDLRAQAITQQQADHTWGAGLREPPQRFVESGWLPAPHLSGFPAWPPIRITLQVRVLSHFSHV